MAKEKKGSVLFEWASLVTQWKRIHLPMQYMCVPSLVWEGSPGEWNGLTPVCWPGKTMDRGAWWATVQGFSKELDTTKQKLLESLNCGLIKIGNTKHFSPPVDSVLIGREKTRVTDHTQVSSWYSRWIPHKAYGRISSPKHIWASIVCSFFSAYLHDHFCGDSR